MKLAIIKISQNPVGNISVLPFQNNFNYGFGPYTRFQYNLNVQPVVPLMLSKNLTLIARTIVPILNQPSNQPPPVCVSSYGCPSTFGISDVQEQLYFAPKTKPGALIWGVGPIFQFPSASPGALGSGKWSAGPDAVALVMPGPWVLGALVTQLWSYAGPSSRAGVSSFLVQPFVNYNIKGGWAISSAPILTANWTAAQNKWAVPLGGGVARTFKDDGQLMSLSLLYYTYVTRPSASPQTNLRLGLEPALADQARRGRPAAHPRRKVAGSARGGHCQTRSSRNARLPDVRSRPAGRSASACERYSRTAG